VATGPGTGPNAGPHRDRDPDPDRTDPPGSDPDWIAWQSSDEFGRLRRALHRFILPTTIAFLSWYLLYVIMAAYARPFMETKVFGTVNVGLVFGLLQFASTFGIAVAYSRYADRRIDPPATRLRNEIEGATVRPATGGRA
jgi:uncharacterized membrane protein (DUF485 family)